MQWVRLAGSPEGFLANFGRGRCFTGQCLSGGPVETQQSSGGEGGGGNGGLDALHPGYSWLCPSCLLRKVQVFMAGWHAWPQQGASANFGGRQCVPRWGQWSTSLYQSQLKHFGGVLPACTVTLVPLSYPNKQQGHCQGSSTQPAVLVRAPTGPQ